MTVDETWLSPKEVAEILKIDVATVRAKAKAGEIPGFGMGPSPKARLV